jgi:hypothetical protein
MRLHRLSLLAIIFFFLCSCGTKPNPKAGKQEEATEAETEVKLNEVLQKRVGSWAKEGAECYGLVLLLRKNKSVEHGKSVKSVIVRMKIDSLKVKVLEDVTLAKTKECNKMGMSVGDTWWEREGDLFLTREEADNFLKAKGWEFKDKKRGRFKIGD